MDISITEQRDKIYDFMRVNDGKKMIVKNKNDISKVYDLLCCDVLCDNGCESDVVYKCYAFYFSKKGNYSNMIKYALISCVKGDDHALCVLGKHYYMLGNTSEALKCWKIALMYGNSDAMWQVGSYYYDMDNLREMEKYCLMAANYGNIESMKCLGNYYIKNDLMKALKYYNNIIDSLDMLDTDMLSVIKNMLFIITNYGFLNIFIKMCNTTYLLRYYVNEFIDVMLYFMKRNVRSDAFMKIVSNVIMIIRENDMYDTFMKVFSDPYLINYYVKEFDDAITHFMNNNFMNDDHKIVVIIIMKIIKRYDLLDVLIAVYDKYMLDYHDDMFRTIWYFKMKGIINMKLEDIIKRSNAYMYGPLPDLADNM